MSKWTYLYFTTEITEAHFLSKVPRDWKDNLNKFGGYCFENYEAVASEEVENLIYNRWLSFINQAKFEYYYHGYPTSEEKFLNHNPIEWKVGVNKLNYYRNQDFYAKTHDVFKHREWATR